MQYHEELDEEVIYDNLMEPSFVRGRSEEKEKHGYYSQWGPKRPKHTMNYPKRSSRCDSYRRCVCHQLSMTCIVFLIILALFTITVSMIIISYYAKGNFLRILVKDVDYGPGDTQNLFFSTIFCDELITNKDTLYPSGFRDSALYLLNEPPSWSGENEIILGNTFSVPYKRNFHLFPGSAIAVKACTKHGDYNNSGSFYLLKGKSTYLDWENAGGDVRKNKSIVYLRILNTCNTDGVQEVRFNVTKEDQYYFVFVNDNTSEQMVTISTNITIQRKLYSFSEGSVIKYCKFNTQPCSLEVPFQISTSVLLTYGEPFHWEGNWSNESIEILCKPRVWFYTVLVALGVLLVALATFIGCLVCCCCSHVLYQVDEAKTPLLNARTGTLYSEAVTPEKEMHNPSVHDSKREVSNHDGAPILYSQMPQAPVEPYLPPSFSKAGTGIGPPSYETFTRP